MSEPAGSPLLRRPLGRLYLATAAPIILVLSMNGLLTVVDAAFLGRYVGESALAAVTLAFPVYMLLVALTTLVSGGMSSLLARALGAGDQEGARRIFSQSGWLALAVSAGLILFYLLAGPSILARAADGNLELAGLADDYLRVLISCSPMLFLLSLQSDGLRNEGRVVAMAGFSLLTYTTNIGLDYLFIVVLQGGVAGSAWATVAVHGFALVLLLAYRARAGLTLRVVDMLRPSGIGLWRSILALGAPQSLNFIGLALVTSMFLACLQLADVAQYEEVVSAFGIINRLMTFAFLPLFGLAQAMQTITGHAFGAGMSLRVKDSLRFAMGIAFVYCAGIEVLLCVAAQPLASIFVDTPEVVYQVTRILPIPVLAYWLTGPLMMLASHFQAIGDVPKAAFLGLAKPYLFQGPLVVLLALSLGDPALWYATPLSDGLLALCALGLLLRRRVRRPA